MSIDKEIEFNKIVADILKNQEFLKLKEENHHGFNRLEHSLNVAKISFLWAKKLKMKNYKEITRAALLHDFFRIDELNGHLQIYHPVIANKNSKKYFGINDMQSNIILSHMFPLTKTMPKHKESWLVSLADKYCACYECARYKMPLETGTLAIFLLNFLVIQR